MATFEIHDSRGNVRRFTVSRDQVSWFGSSPECEMPLDGPGIAPIHGRLRFKDADFRVEVIKDGPDIFVNGKPSRTARLRRGDEIRVGGCRVFLINPDEEEGELAPLSAEFQIDDLKPPSPTAGGRSPQGKEGRSPKPVSASSEAEAKPRRSREAKAPKAGNTPAWLESLEAGAESVAPSSAAKSILDPADAAYERSVAGAAQPSRLGRFGGLFSESRPGQESLVRSPAVLSLGLALVALVVVAFILWGVIRKTTSERLWRAAEQAMEASEFRNAVARYGEFLAYAPKDPRAGKAQARRGLASVQQFLAGGGNSFENAVKAAREMKAAQINLPEYQDARIDLAALVLQSAEGLATRTASTGSADDLKLTEDAAKLHVEIAGKAAEPQLGRSKLPAKLEQAKAAVEKARIRTESLAAIDAALEAQKAEDVYAARNALVARYADQATDKGVVGRVEKANELIREGVVFEAARGPAQSGPHPDPLGPPLSLVIRDQVRPATTGAGSSIVYALADGHAYALDGATGAPLWHIPVGASSPFIPRPVTGDAAAIAFDARHDELIRINARTGEVAWRQALGGPIQDAPMLLGNQLVQATLAGDLAFLDLATGEIQGRMKLGRPIRRAPAIDESAQHLYAVADDSNLFVLTREPPDCAAVLYLGHAAGSIPCPPTRIGPYLVVSENHELDRSRLRIFGLRGDGSEVQQIQELGLEGWTWGEPAFAGTRLWGTADRGGIVSFAIGPPDAKEPFSAVATLAAEKDGLGPIYARSRTEGEIWVAGRRSAQYTLDDTGRSLQASWTLPEGGPALGPIQMAGNLIVLVRETVGRTGTEVTAVDPRRGQVAWRTTLGSRWLAPLIPTGDGLLTLAPDGRPLAIPGDKVASGGFIEVAEYTPPPGSQVPKGPWTILTSEGDRITAASSKEADNRLMGSGGGADPHEIILPAAPSTPPLAWNGSLLAPMEDGRVFLIDPATGGTRSTPLIVPFDRASPIRWARPAPLAGAALLADRSGVLSRIVADKDGALSLETQANVGAPLLSDPATTPEAILVVTSDNRVQSRAARDLSAQGAAPLEAPLAMGPIAADAYVFLADAAGKLYAYGANGTRAWSVPLPGQPLIGPPVVRDGMAWALGRDGLLHQRALGDGAERAKINLDIVPAGPPLNLPSGLIIPSGAGTLRRYNSPPATPGGGEAS